MNKSGKGLGSITMTLLLVFSMLFISNSLMGQDINEKITQAIKTSNSAELSKYFNNSIDLTIPGSEGIYSKVQAEHILKSFFVKYPPTSLVINHTGKSNDGSIYAIGTYKSATNTYRTYFLTKSIDGNLLIHQLKFESKQE